MTLTGTAAQRHPEVDVITSVTINIATHTVANDGYGVSQRESAGADRADVIGVVDPETGAYRSASNAVTETDRRSLGLRRNGRPRRHPAARSSQ